MARPEPTPALQGSFRLFRVAGISVYLHWSWLLVAYFEIQSRADFYKSQAWNVAEYLSLFIIVLLHEFGHALACRQVGGKADQIVLWPLGGIAYVNPPARPGAWLWSIAAGPLVNVILVPLTFGSYIFIGLAGWAEVIDPDLDHFLFAVTFMNLFLLIFNMLPIYPLDGGQIVQALLWFIIGRAKSLMVVSVIGMVVGGGVLILAMVGREIWYVLLAVFVVFRSLAGFQQSRIMARMLSAPKHTDAFCPSCQTAPVMGDFWVCDKCQARFDTFAHHAVCPGCGKQFAETMCLSCGRANPIETWFNARNQADEFDNDPRRV